MEASLTTLGHARLAMLSQAKKAANGSLALRRQTHAVAEISLLSSWSSTVGFRSVSAIYSATRTRDLVAGTTSARPDARTVGDEVWITGCRNVGPSNIFGARGIVFVELEHLCFFLVEVGAGVGSLVFEDLDEAVEANCDQ